MAKQHIFYLKQRLSLIFQFFAGLHKVHPVYLKGPSTIRVLTFCESVAHRLTFMKLYVEFQFYNDKNNVFEIKIPYLIVNFIFKYPELSHKNEKGAGMKNWFLRLEKYTDRVAFEQMKNK
jgi:hypothetical protein